MQSSIYTTDAHTQPSGARYVYERHVDVTGRVYTVHPWLAPASWTEQDIQDRVNARATEIDATLAENEAAALLEQD